MTTVEESIPDNELPASIPLPEGWLWTTVSSLGEFDGEAVKTGPFGAILKSKEFVSSGIPILAVGNVQSGHLDLKNARVDHITEKKATELSDYRLRAGDVLFTRSGTIGRSAVVPQSADGWMMSYHLLRVRPNQLLINPQYLYFVFAGCQVSQQYTQDSTIGTTRPGINTQILKDVPVPLPPRAEQDRMVARIDELFSLVCSARDHLSKIPLILKRFRQAVLASACSGKLTEGWRNRQENLEPASRLVERIASMRSRASNGACVRTVEAANLPAIPEEWTWVYLPDLGCTGRGRSRHRPRDAAHLYGGPYPFIQTGDIAQSGGRIKSHTQTYSQAGLEQSKLWPAGTVCITIAANIAHSAILTYPSCFPDSVVGVIPDADFCLKEYVEFFIRTARADLEQYAPATAQKNINLGVLSDVAVPLPPYREQQEIVRITEALLAAADAIECHVVAASQSAGRVTQAILAKAFRGELVPPEAELARRDGRQYEPASVLLERIRAEGASHAKNPAVPKRKLRRASAHV